MDRHRQECLSHSFSRALLHWIEKLYYIQSRRAAPSAKHFFLGGILRLNVVD